MISLKMSKSMLFMPPHKLLAEMQKDLLEAKTTNKSSQ
jgi:hypothetical protein